MREVCEHLGGVSHNTVAAYIRAGMPAHQLMRRGRYLFDLAEVDRWIYSRWNQHTAGQDGAA